MPDECKHCGACAKHDRCDHCGYCRKCGVFVMLPPGVTYVPVYPFPVYPAPYTITWNTTSGVLGGPCFSASVIAS